jgi:hypothetical protein
MPSCELSQTALLDLYLTAALLRIDTLSDVEHASEGIAFRVPDSTLACTFERIAPRPFRNVLRQQIRDGLHNMTLCPVGLPMGMLVIDGKTTWTGDHCGDSMCQFRENC